MKKLKLPKKIDEFNWSTGTLSEIADKYELTLPEIRSWRFRFSQDGGFFGLYIYPTCHQYMMAHVEYEETKQHRW